MFFVYVIRNDKSGKFYTGQTAKLQERLERHNGYLKHKKTSFTYRNKGIWKLVYKEELATRKEAMLREKELKSAKGREYIKKAVLQ